METGSEEIPLPRGVALAWGVAEHPQRGPKRELSIERIVDAAVEIADADGLGAVSMSAVASRLGFTTMSLYRYVTNKDELLMVMGELAQGLPPLSLGEASSWREGLVAYHRAVLDTYEAHPWLLDVPISGTPTTPANAAWFDAGLAALDATPLDWLEKTAVLLLVLGHLRWTATVERGYTARAADEGVTATALDRASQHILSSLVTAEAYPQLRRALDAGVLAADTDPFGFGLERLLDGVQAYLEQREQGAAPGVPAAEPAADASDTFPKDPKVRAARLERKAAERSLREAERTLREAVKREREAVTQARAKAARDNG